MDIPGEHEMCGNCKKEIPQHNYVMHTAHCARNITLCQKCKEPISKSEFKAHDQKCVSKPVKKRTPSPPKTNLEKSDYFQTRKALEDLKIAERKQRYLQRHEKFVDNGYSMKSSSSSQDAFNKGDTTKQSSTETKTQTSSNTSSFYKTQAPKEKPQTNGACAPPSLYNGATKKPSGLLACKFCDLELPKLELEEHENYCGSRTDKCLECGELVMFKYKQIHMDSNHGFLKLKDEPGPKPSWDSTTQRSSNPEPARRRPEPFRPFSFDSFNAMDYIPPSYGGGPPPTIKKKEGESYKEISRRLDCKTEYIRNLLHDSASITVPLRSNGAVPRNHFNHQKAGPAPQPPSRRRNPPTELTIPCEFCGVPVPHEDLIQHETGCRPDLARLRRRSPEPDDYYMAPPEPEPHSPEVELPCEFCADMIPASQLLRHQAACV